MNDRTTIGNTSFFVYFGNDKLSFSRVSNLSREIEYETISEGGVNDYVHTVSKGKQQQQTIVFEKGVSYNSLSELEGKGLKLGGTIREPVTIVIANNTSDKKSKVVRSYVFEEGLVTKWELGDLNAMNGEVLIEKIEIVHSGLKEERYG